MQKERESPMTSESCRSTLKEIGRVLLVIGACDALAVFMLGFALIEIRTFLAPFFLIAGLFLYWQRLGAVRIVLVITRMLIAAIPAAFVGLFIVQPLGLTLANFRAEPASWFYLAFAVAYLLALRWLVLKLTSPSIIDACGRKMLKVGNPRASYALVAMLALVVFVDEAYGDADIKHKAEQLAMEKLGHDFQYKARGHKVVQQNQQRHTFVVVTAWNDHELRQTIVDWVD